MSYLSEDILTNPVTGTNVFGLVPEISVRGGPTFPAGPIHLKYGLHRGPHKGFGFQHIWKQHFREHASHEAALPAVIEFIQKALPASAPLFYEYGNRLEVFRIYTGRVIIELYDRSVQPHYSVVSAGYRPKSAAGARVGALVRSLK